MTEIAEAIEELRKDTSHKQLLKYLGKELADIAIRDMDLAEWLNINLEVEIQAKHEINKTRPYRHKKLF